MQTLPSGIKKVEASDTATVANFNINAELLDEKLIKLDGVAPRAGSADSATDSVIGKRSIDDTIVAATGSDTPTRLWSKLAYMIKGMSGTANWWTLPSMTITAIIDALGLKAPLASPALTGTPTAPTAAAGTSTTQLATTAFVKADSDVLKKDAQMVKITKDSGDFILSASTASDNILDMIVAAGAGLRTIYASSASSGLPTATSLRGVAFASGTTGNLFGWVIVVNASNIMFTNYLGASSWSGWKETARTASPVLTGTPTAPTAAKFDVTKKIATTEFVRNSSLTRIAPVQDTNAFRDLDAYYTFDTGDGAATNTPEGNLAQGSGRLFTVQNVGVGADRLEQTFTFHFDGGVVRKYLRCSQNSTTWGAWTQIATSVYLSEQNYAKQTDVMVKGIDNQSINKVKAISLENDTRSTVVTRDTSNRIVKVEEKDGSVVVISTEYTRDLITGAITKIVEVAGGTTVTYLIARDPVTNKIQSITKS